MRNSNKTIAFILCFLWVNFLSAQDATYNIKGYVTDTLDVPLIAATIILMEKSDSTMVDFTRTELDGSFVIRDIPFGNYLLKTNYVGYIPTTVDANSPDGKNLDLGKLQMSELATELMEVVIKAAKAPIKMRGDTVEYDATTFKVPDGSTVEDLLRRLPGIELEQDGSITAEGKNVSKVTVDGKAFFGSDPTTATKNLPAEGISKVQVFDTKTEEDELVGKSGESEDKTMNLELKEEFKAGSFGKVVAGAGTESRREIKGNINKFNDKFQFSIIGVGNNTGRNGLGWNDYQDFMGSQSWSFTDDTDYGFGGGRGYYTFGGNSSSGIESSIQAMFFNGGGNRGLPENYNGGVNFNYDNKKTQVSTVYYYNQAGLEYNRIDTTDRFLPDFTIRETKNEIKNDISRGHRFETEITHELDSLHTIRWKFNGAFIDNTENTFSDVVLNREVTEESNSNFDNDEDTDGSLINTMLLFRKKFKKKGRSLGVNGSYLNTALNDFWTQVSTTQFFDDNGDIDSTFILNQDNRNEANKVQWKANALYSEPLSAKVSWVNFYNYSNRNESGFREIFDDASGERSLNEDLSREYENIISFNRWGSYFRYNNDGTNIALGLAYQSFDLNGDFNGLGNSDIAGIVNKTFTNWIPYFSFGLTPDRNTRFNLGFSRNATEPNIEDLQPIVNNLNPLFIKVGNPDLIPEVENRINLDLSKSFPLSGTRFYLNTSFTFYENKFSTEEFIDEDLVTTYTPINIDGGGRWSNWSGVNFPIIKNKIKARVNFSGNLTNYFALVNGVENETTVMSYSPSLRLTITPAKDMIIYLNSRLNISSTDYRLNNLENQKTRRYVHGVEFNTKLFAGLYLESDFNYSLFRNERFDFSEDVPILNASLRRFFLEGNKLEARISVYDAFNRNVSINQSASGNSFTTTRTNALGRYIMFSLSYNIRGNKAGVSKRRW